MIVIKRDGRISTFDPVRIVTAIRKAFKQVDGEISNSAIEKSLMIAEAIANLQRDLKVDEIEKSIIEQLEELGRKDVGDAYKDYMEKRKEEREKNSTIFKNVVKFLDGDESYKGENSNKDTVLAPTQRDYFAGIVSREMTKVSILPKDIVDADEEGIIHFHDSDYSIQRIHNCDLINLEDMLQNGTVISETMIEKPHKFSTACTIATQAIAQVASSQYGGQSISLAHLAPFVNETRKKFRKDDAELLGYMSEDKFNEYIEKKVKEDIATGVQTLQYQVVTLMTTNGQAPFITFFMYLNEVDDEQEKKDLALIIEEVLRQRIRGVKNKDGVWVSPSFPKLIYVLEENNITEDTPYFYLTRLAAECSAKRLVPDYISEKIMKEYKNGDVYTCMGCRSFLTPDRFSEKVGNVSNAKNFDKHKGHVYYGRFNQGVVTINLPDIALSSNGDFDKFWELFEERTELCHKALRLRHERLLGTNVNIAPILWKYGALARLGDGETIDKLLYNGYSTISLGYAGLYECVKYMTGCSHSDEGVGEKFGLEVMQKLNDKCSEWKSAENIDYSIYGTPLESATYKFAKSLQKRFGKIEGITDRDYITNSYHIPVFEEIDPFEKLRIESKFQRLSPGGAISYIETADMTSNIDAVISVMQYIYENIMYAELNTKSDYCQVCGYDKEIELIDKDGQLIWRCPNCGNEDTRKMNVVRRTCGYLGTATNGWNQGRLGDIHDRYIHLDNHEVCG